MSERCLIPPGKKVWDKKWPRYLVNSFVSYSVFWMYSYFEKKAKRKKLKKKLNYSTKKMEKQVQNPSSPSHTYPTLNLQFYENNSVPIIRAMMFMFSIGPKKWQIHISLSRLILYYTQNKLPLVFNFDDLSHFDIVNKIVYL